MSNAFCALISGGIIFESGLSANNIYIVKSGFIKIEFPGRDDVKRIVSIATPGQVCGLEVMVSANYNYSATAIRDTTVCQLQKYVAFCHY